MGAALTFHGIRDILFQTTCGDLLRRYAPRKPRLSDSFYAAPTECSSITIREFVFRGPPFAHPLTSHCPPHAEFRITTISCFGTGSRRQRLFERAAYAPLPGATFRTRVCPTTTTLKIQRQSPPASALNSLSSVGFVIMPKARLEYISVFFSLQTRTTASTFGADIDALNAPILRLSVTAEEQANPNTYPHPRLCPMPLSCIACSAQPHSHRLEWPGQYRRLGRITSIIPRRAGTSPHA